MIIVTNKETTETMKNIALQLNEKFYSLNSGLRFFIAAGLCVPSLYVHPIFALVLIPMLCIKHVKPD